MSTGNVERVICAILRGEPCEWAGGADAAAVDHFLDAGRRHGVLPLIAQEFQGRQHLQEWPEAIHLACRTVTRAQAMYELTQCAEVLGVLDALAVAGVRPLLLKGTGLAYGLYPNPTLRPRSDSDLLVASRDVAATAQIALTGRGYRRITGPAGRFVGFQVEMRRDARTGSGFNFDLHWRISNHQAFAWLFEFDELARTAVPVPALGPHALRLGNVEALILALLHRAGNERSDGPGAGDKLIWLYDIHLLVGTLSGEETTRFRELAEGKRVVGISLAGLRRCADFFGSPRLLDLIRALEHSNVAESGLHWLRAGRLRYLWLEFRAVPGLRRRLSYVGSRLVPDIEYMRERYPDAAGRSPAALRLLRLFHGCAGMARRLFGGIWH